MQEVRELSRARWRGHRSTLIMILNVDSFSKHYVSRICQDYEIHKGKLTPIQRDFSLLILQIRVG